jgi:hypothetical protein
MKLALTLAAVAAFFAVYFIWVRPYLRTLPALTDAWKQEETLLAALKLWLEGRKTILSGIWGEIVAFLPDVLQILAGVDLKTALGLPDNWALIVGGIVVPFLMLIFRTKAKAG